MNKILDIFKYPGSPDTADPIRAIIQIRDVINRKVVLKRIYEHYYRMIMANIAPFPDYPTVELGSGCGLIKEFFPEVITTDIVKSTYIDICADAEKLPFNGKSIGNIIFLDMLHHIAKPYEFLKNAAEYLIPGGRLVFIEPYISPSSWFLYRFLHAEKGHFDMAPNRHEWNFKNPFLDANTAIPTILFCKNFAGTKKEMNDMWEIKKIDSHNLFTHALSGGYTYRNFLPLPLYHLLVGIEKLLPRVLRKYLCMMLCVVLERKPEK